MNSTKVFIGIQYDRWIALKEENGAIFYTKVAKILLEQFVFNFLLFLF